MPKTNQHFPRGPLALSIALVSCLLLAACATTGNLPQVVGSASCNPPSEELALSKGPHALPKGAMSQKDIVRHWGKDRSDFGALARKHNGLTQFVTGNCK